ncbi:hypothetical protein [Shinella zoogloeoides]|uniref:hypothetical protein n=1 Tax=Shinella zoogloeoides TaxID=352475 RepID=UPI001F561C05|nr:hypothetical protein [Shinella zoogloeoides]
MAKPGELAELIARRFRLEVATVRQQARELRDHGLMSKEKAGRGAGSMTARDAAHLLVAAAVTTSVKKSVECVHQYQSCRVTDWRGHRKRWALGFLPCIELNILPDDHSIIDVIEAALISFSKGDWADEHNPFTIVQAGLGKPEMRIYLSGPIVSASSNIMLVSDESRIKRPEKLDAEAHYYGDPNAEKIDYTFQAVFTHITLIEIANLLRT